MNNEVIFWNYFLKDAENQPDYINRCITEPTKISNTQKRFTKQAILWILAKAPHTVEEISDHFEISSELVKSLITELTEANFVIEEHGSLPRYRSNIKKKASINKKTKISFPSYLILC